jgi:hypothetical protein
VAFNVRFMAGCGRDDKKRSIIVEKELKQIGILRINLLQTNSSPSNSKAKIELNKGSVPTAELGVREAKLFSILNLQYITLL